MQVGDIFHRLTIIRLIPDLKNPKAECVCLCGNKTISQRGALKNGRAKSCGCLKKEIFRNSRVIHGLTQTTEYSVFQGMLARCNNPNEPAYKNYGGRGIKVLYKSIKEFIEDVGLRPKNYWIERIDNDLSYQAGNCKWVSPKENSLNKRTSKFWIVNGVEYRSSVEAASALNILPCTVIRGCNGYFKRGKFVQPRPGWSCYLKYEE